MTDLTNAQGRSTAKRGDRNNDARGAMKQSLNEAEKKGAQAFLSALEVFRAVRPTMPLQYVVTLMLVAMDEGKSVTEYARQLGVSQSVMSRHLLDIGERNRHMEKGFGFVMYKSNPLNLREHEYYLTPHGRIVVQQVLRALRS